MEARSSSENGKNHENNGARNLEKEVIINGGGGGEDEETLKMRILEHPLYGLLMETHMDCLKVMHIMYNPRQLFPSLFVTCMQLLNLELSPYDSKTWEKHATSITHGSQVGLGATEADRINASNQRHLEVRTDRSSSDLDLFMEAYCVTLSKLKEAMEEPLQETASFIKAMYDQLEELGDNYPNPPRPPALNK